MSVLEFERASVLASEIVCMYLSDDNEYIVVVELSSGTKLDIEPVGYEKARDVLARCTKYWKNALTEED